MAIIFFCELDLSFLSRFHVKVRTGEVLEEIELR